MWAQVMVGALSLEAGMPSAFKFLLSYARRTLSHCHACWARIAGFIRIINVIQQEENDEADVMRRNEDADPWQTSTLLFNFYPFCRCICSSMRGGHPTLPNSAGLCLSLNVLTTSACPLLEGWREGSPFQDVPTDREGQDESLLYKYFH